MSADPIEMKLMARHENEEMRFFRNGADAMREREPRFGQLLFRQHLQFTSGLSLNCFGSGDPVFRADNMVLVQGPAKTGTGVSARKALDEMPVGH